ncbi:hypothetical protein BU24DRAFT_421371 [Aaosphaeria arxii CBS 175.79]|uniref:Uncharacterized protein n=1 Tax=Aaosphaeria arxii CBS 175.79 TaxID=1450172 RepID=A0A6A5Y0C5_9PLEO|nr:uncharacterized protein BU24DRAFT_421371 [Aaosphaeria arxii CBS 175.79]KAF2018381.1 hypothetical protein BU24DRAFT_421371 [Aaosphaeria arxii CBS 175.79]
MVAPSLLDGDDDDDGDGWKNDSLLLLLYFISPSLPFDDLDTFLFFAVLFILFLISHRYEAVTSKRQNKMDPDEGRRGRPTVATWATSKVNQSVRGG